MMGFSGHHDLFLTAPAPPVPVGGGQQWWGLAGNKSHSQYVDIYRL